MSHSQVILFSFILVFLLILAAFFSLAETGLMAVNRYRLRHVARLKKKYAIRILKLLKRPDRLLGAILIGNNFATMLASSLATLIAYHFWGDKGGLLAAAFLTLIVLIFAEIAPKTVAAIHPERTARLVAYPIKLVLILLYPLVWLTNAVANGLLRLFRVRVTDFSMEPLSREELRSMVYDTTGKISRQYQNMLLSILDLSKLTVNDVMVPRHEISGIDILQPIETILDQINKLNQDWLPIYRENLNDMIGVLYAHDLFKLLLVKAPLDKDLIEKLLQHPYFVPEGTSLNVQLGYFQQSQHKIAFVVDEYGEILGLLTLNDILEEIVGDFTSSVTGGKRFQQQPDGSYLVDGAMTVREFNRLSEWDLPLHGPRTINGLLVEHLEALPHASTAVLIAGYPIEIVQVKENRVRLARIFPKIKTESE